ncbi:MAG: DUF4398 domain-containing protein, partial [Cytophagaceae bacterium]
MFREIASPARQARRSQWARPGRTNPMNTLRLSLVRSTAMTALAATLSLGGFACASYPAPSEHLASSMAAVRGAQEVGAAQVPRAALHLKLAEDQIAQAKQFMQD